MPGSRRADTRITGGSPESARRCLGGHSRARFRFYAELNDFLPPADRHRDIDYVFSGNPAIKDPIEALGVPHPEVDLIVLNGRSVGFDARLADGDRAAVYPVFESFDITPLVRLRDRPLRRPAFVVDVNLGKLARHLRLLGFDTLYRNDLEDGQIVRISAAERRTILTRDRRLLCIGAVTHGYWVRSDWPEEQVVEVVARFDLVDGCAPLTRCLECNGELAKVTAAAVSRRVPAHVAETHEKFVRCTGCRRIYWRGTHQQRLVERSESYLVQARARLDRLRSGSMT